MNYGTPAYVFSLPGSDQGMRVDLFDLDRCCSMPTCVLAGEKGFIDGLCFELPVFLFCNRLIVGKPARVDSFLKIASQLSRSADRSSEDPGGCTILARVSQGTSTCCGPGKGSGLTLGGKESSTALATSK